MAHNPSSARSTRILKATPREELPSTTPRKTSDHQGQPVVSQTPSGSSHIIHYYDCDDAEIRLPESYLSEADEKNARESYPDVSDRLELLLNTARGPSRHSLQIGRLPSWVSEDVRREFEGRSPKGEQKIDEGKNNNVTPHREADHKSAVSVSRTVQLERPRQSAAFWRNAKRPLLTALVIVLLGAAVVLGIRSGGIDDTDTSPRGDDLDGQERALRGLPATNGALDGNNRTESGTTLGPETDRTEAGEDVERYEGSGSPTSHTVEAGGGDSSG